MNGIRVKKLSPKAALPTYGSSGAAGADLYACLDEAITIAPGGNAWIPTGLACKKGLAPANKVGVIDSDYRGPVTVVLYNHGSETQTICHGERIAQMVITPVLTPAYEWDETLSETDRGQGGFGSTGK